MLGQALGQGDVDDNFDELVAPRGYRQLSRIPRLPDRMIDRLVGKFGSLQRLMNATLAELDEVEGIGEMRARSIKEGLVRLSESSALDRYA
jgi:diadenylate cyclase